MLSLDTPSQQYQLMQGDCLEVLDTLPAEHVDVIWTDPPYFLSNGGSTCKSGKRVKVDKGKWDESKGLCENHEFYHQWLSKCQRVLKPDGTLWVSATHHSLFSIGFAMQELGFKVLNLVTWEKPNPPPNLSCRYFTHSTETLIWAAMNDKSKHTFNYAAMRQANNGKQMKTVWTFPAPSKAEKLHGKHPTQKPVALVRRCLEASCSKDSLVLDPFLGIGTTGVACLELGRRFIGIEKDREFLRTAEARMEAATPTVFPHVNPQQGIIPPVHVSGAS